LGGSLGGLGQRDSLRDFRRVYRVKTEITFVDRNIAFFSRGKEFLNKLSEEFKQVTLFKTE